VRVAQGPAQEPDVRPHAQEEHDDHSGCSKHVMPAGRWARAGPAGDPVFAADSGELT
jgi:hypothetical protein